MKTIKLFVDDEREPYMVDVCENAPSTWIIARSYQAAIDVLSTRAVSHITLDHDLGDGPTGYDLCKWMSANFAWPDNVTFHSMNPVGKKNMMDEYSSYLKWRGYDYDEQKPNGPID